MKKLKCDSCGGELVVDENKEFATCSYCNTKYKLNVDHTVTFKVDEATKEMLTSGAKTFSKVSLVIIIPMVIITLLIFGLVGYGIYKEISGMNISNPNGHIGTEIDDDDFEEEYNKVKDQIEKGKQQYDIQNYNSDYEFYSGTQTKNSIIHLLDKVVTNNKTNKSNLITVKHKNINSTDPNQIIKIKSLLKDFSDNKRSIVKYEVIFDYNDTGYLSTITIK